MSRHRKFTIAEQELWIQAGMPTDTSRVESLLDSIAFTDELPRPQEPIQQEAADVRNVER